MEKIKNLIVYRDVNSPCQKNNILYFQLLLDSKNFPETIMLKSKNVIPHELKGKGIKKVIALAFNDKDLDIFIANTKQYEDIEKIAISADYIEDTIEKANQHGIKLVPMPINRETFYSLLI